MTRPSQPLKRCVVYTRKSSEEGLEQDFNSLHAQREACEAFIKSQHSEGWRLIGTAYDDGGFSGGTLERPALQRLLADIADGRVQIVVVYKVDRLTRSLADFAKLVEHFDRYGASFVAVTQQFNTTSSMGRLTLNILLSFAQFEREVTGERIRDKIAASKRKGMWMGGNLPLGYTVKDRKLMVVPAEARTVQHIYERYRQLGNVRRLKEELDRDGIRSKLRASEAGNRSGGKPLSRGALYTLLANPIYIGEIRHKAIRYPGQHRPILDQHLWETVQQQLRAQGSARKDKPNNSESSCLTGKIFDETGERLTPSHTVNHGRRYRYYVSRSLMKGKGRQDKGWRLPAPMIERQTADAAAKMLEDHAAIMDALEPVHLDGTQTSAIIEAVKPFRTRLLADDQREAALATLVERIELQSGAIRLTLALKSLLPEQLAAKNLTLTQTIPLQISRRGVGTKLILDDPNDAAPPNVNAALLRLGARSRAWFEALATGAVRSIAELAARDGLGESYVSSLLPLAFLAPPILEAAAQGRLPASFPLSAMTNRPDIPIGWHDQLRAFSIR